MASASPTGTGPRAIALGEVLAFDELHHDGVDTVCILEAVDRRDVRVVERRQQLGFALESGQVIGIGRQRGRQGLQRHVAIELRIARAIHLAHAACS